MIFHSFTDRISNTTKNLNSKIDAIPEALDDGVEGFLVNPGDPASLGAAILKIYRDPSLGGKLGKAGRARVLKQFSYDVMVGRCVAHVDLSAFLCLVGQTGIVYVGMEERCVVSKDATSKPIP